MLNKLMVLMSALSFTAAAQAAMNTYTYRARIPQSALSCADEAAALSLRFTQATRLHVAQAECMGAVNMPADGQVYALDVLVLTYHSDRPVAPSVTSFEDDIGAALYASYAACLTDLSVQAKGYQDNTGLIPVAAYCMPAEGVVGSGYELKLESFGTPRARLHSLRPFSFATDATSLSSVRELLKQHGAIIVRENQGVFFYYSASNLGLSTISLGLFSNAAQCSVQAAEAEKISQSLMATVMMTKCVQDTDAGLFSLDILSNGYKQLSSDQGLLSPRYYTFEECLQDKDRALAEAAHGRNVRGGICNRDMTSNFFVLNIFSVY